MDAVLAGLCADHGINLAQKAEVEIAGRRFLCTTLWSDFSLPADPARLTEMDAVIAYLQSLGTQTRAAWSVGGEDKK